MKGDNDPLYEYLYEKLADSNVVGLIICSVEKSGHGLSTDIHEFTNNEATPFMEEFISHLADLFLQAQEDELKNYEGKDDVVWN